MAVVSPVPAIAQRVDSIRCPDIRVSSRREILEEPVARVIEDKIYVAVAKQVKESKSVLLWALQNSGGKRICIIHVYSPAQMIPVPGMGTKFLASSLEEEEVQAYREIERQDILKHLDEYLLICRQMGSIDEKKSVPNDVGPTQCDIELYTCKICNIAVNGTQEYMSHMRGERHQKTLNGAVGGSTPTLTLQRKDGEDRKKRLKSQRIRFK